ncbi:hypothetical protein HGB07_00050 [Candidatus Roizmanbacteria bacterium]|nr:hypothetical protein [Candidatus Roizmanbacteria bacterium]
MTKINPKRIKELQKLLKEQTGNDYTVEEAQESGIAIIRFMIAKERHKQQVQHEAKN